MAAPDRLFCFLLGMFTEGQYYVASFSPTGVLKPRVSTIHVSKQLSVGICVVGCSPLKFFDSQVWSNPHSVPSEAGPHFDNFAAARFPQRDSIEFESRAFSYFITLDLSYTASSAAF